MKRFYIIIFLIMLFLPPLIWQGIRLTDSDLFTSLDYDLGEKRNKTEIEDVSQLALSSEVITDYFADRAPFRSSVITLKRTVDSAIESPYEEDIKPAAMKALYDVEDSRDVMTAQVISQVGERKIYKSDKIKEVLDETEESKETYEDIEEESLYEITEEQPADCLNPGYRVSINIKTGEEFREEFEATGHDWQINEVVEPTYISYGYTEYICKNCGETKTDDWTEKLIDTSYLAPNVHGDTIIGRFDWLFLHGWGNIPYYQATNILSEEEMAVYADRLNTLQALCDARGVRLAVIWIPSKDTVYPEYMPDFEVRDNYKRVPRLADYINAHSSARFAFIKDELTGAKRYWDTYYRYDSHWNFVGAYIGVQSMYRLLDMPQTDIRYLQVTKESREASGDLIELGGLNANDFSPYYEYVVHYKDNVVTTYETEESVLSADVYRTEADVGNDTRFVMIGDSFRNFMVPYIKKDFNHCTFVYRDNVRDVTDDILSANVLVLQSAERYDYKSLSDMEYLIWLFSSQQTDE